MSLLYDYEIIRSLLLSASLFRCSRLRVHVVNRRDYKSTHKQCGTQRQTIYRKPKRGKRINKMQCNNAQAWESTQLKQQVALWSPLYIDVQDQPSSSLHQTVDTARSVAFHCAQNVGVVDTCGKHATEEMRWHNGSWMAAGWWRDFGHVNDMVTPLWESRRSLWLI